MNLKSILFASSCFLFLCSCSTAKYNVVRNDNVNIQTVEATAPVGETAVIVVYFGPEIAPLVKAGVDSTDLVNATAAAGRLAVNTALKLKGH